VSYLEYTVKTVPAGPRKLLYFNWPLAVVLIAVAGVGAVMLYSVAGGQFSRWAEPQLMRFAAGFVLMLIVGLVPLWFWRNMSVLAYGVSLRSCSRWNSWASPAWARSAGSTSA